MITNDDYLYWINPDNPNFSKETVWREMYSRIGYLFHIYQMCEYNIANILAIELLERENREVYSINDLDDLKKRIDNEFIKLSHYTFGQLKTKVEKSKYLKGIDYTLLGEVVNARNDLAHHCFKDKLLKSELNTLDDVEKFIKELNDEEEKARKLNDYLVKVFSENRIKQVIFLDQIQKM